MNRRHTFPLTLTALAVAAAFPSYAANPETAAHDAAQTQSLKEVTVRATKVGRRTKEVTGLGKIVKTSETLNKEQVLGIRDLTRYDPGVAVVEQGNGASGGYSIRGVDKNRVAVSVDGVAQIQAFTVQGALSGYGGRGGSGAINEIEYENVGTVEIDKGAGSSDHGSGALGGAVSLRTKEAADLISDGKSWGIQAKTAYGSKNRQFMKSLGAGFSKDGWEGLLIRTERQARETSPHNDISEAFEYGIDRLDAFRQTYNIQNPDKEGEYFLTEDDGSTPKPVAKVAGNMNYLNNQLNRWVGERRSNNKPLSSEEEAMVREAQPRHENLSAQAYTGGGRILPDPMDYRSGSWLAKLGYRFGGRHYLGGVFEDTKQRYDIRDMTEKQYYGTDEAKKFSDKSGVYDGNDFRDGLYFVPNIEAWDKNKEKWVKGIGLKYSRTKFIDEHHRRRRMGLLYRYENEAYSDNWADKAVLSFDKQSVDIDNNTLLLHCAVYPSVDKACRASAANPYSYDRSDRFHYREQHNVLNASFEKSLKNEVMKHHLTFGFGYDASKAVSRPEQLSHNAAMISEHTGKESGNYGIYRLGSPVVVEGSVCDYIETLRSRKCQPRTIKGSNVHIALNDRFSIGKYFDFSLGGRYDRQNFTTSEELVRSGRYTNRSWNGGIVFKPSRHLSLSYRASSGFRTPSFQELFGIDIYHDYPKGWQRPALKSEKAANREIGLQWKGDFGFLEISSFRNRYADLIAVADQYVEMGNGTKIAVRDYHNAQNMSLQGINILGKIDWNGVYGKLPEGLYTTLAYNRIKPKSVSNRPDLSLRSYALDAVQPARYVLGLGYDRPDGKWGANIMLTYSKGKNPDELAYLAGDQKRYSAGRVTSSWKTADVSAYLNLKKRLTLRAGIYNIGNYRYVTWESLRQTAESTANRRGDDSNYGRYAAPGRNFSLALEMKF